MKKSYLALALTLSIIPCTYAVAQQSLTKAGVVYCNNPTGERASCAMYYYSLPHHSPIRGQALIENQNIININVTGTSVISVNSNIKQAPNITLVQQNIGEGGELITDPMQWVDVGAGKRCETPRRTCTLKVEAVLDTGCSCASPKGRIRGIVIQ